MNATVTVTEGTITTADGVELFERCWRPAGEPRGVVVLVHGYAEHCGRYDHVGRALAERGYVVESYDQRSHGRSAGKPGSIHSFAPLVADLRRFLARVRTRYPGRPVFLLGHSMGGMVVTAFAVRERPDVQGIILSGPAVLGRGGVARVTTPIFATLGRLAPNLPLSALKAETVSRDPAVVQAYDQDPLVYRGKLDAGTMRAFADALGRIKPGMGSISVPLLLLHGTADELVEVEASRQLHARARSTDKTLRIYDGLAHEVLNEPEKDSIIAEVLTWLDERTPSASD